MKSLRKILNFFGTLNGLRLLSVVAAVCVWYAIRLATSNSMFVTEIPLVVQPPADWSVVECSARTVDVSFLGTRDDLRYLNREMIKVTIDARAHDGNQTFAVVLGAANINMPGNARIDFIRPGTVQLRLDREMTKQVPIKVETQNLLPDGYEIEKTVVTPATVVVSGPTLLVESIEFVSTAPVDLDGRIRSFNKRRLQLVLGDHAEGVKMDPSSITLDMGIVERSVSARFAGLPVLPMWPAGSTRRAEIEPDVATLTVKGRPELVHALTADDLRLFVDFSSVDDAKLSKIKTLPVRAVLPNGVVLVRTEPSSVEIRVKE